MRKTRTRIISALILSICMLCTVMLINTNATSSDTNSITLTCQREETILSGQQWKLFRIGTRDVNKIVFIPELSKYTLGLGEFTEADLETAATTLESYVTAEGIQASFQGETDENGNLTFENLENGLYLAVGDYYEIGDILYFPSNILLEVGSSDSHLSHDAFPKYYTEQIMTSLVGYTLKKEWMNDDSIKEKRPVSITVDLFKDGELSETVILNEENNWEYRWETLTNKSKWVVAERDIPSNYIALVESNRYRFLINNYYEETESLSTDISSGTTQVSTVPTTLATPTTPVTTKTTDKLVQTGQLWWPVMLLSVGGVLLIGIGLSVDSDKKKNEK